MICLLTLLIVTLSGYAAAAEAQNCDNSATYLQSLLQQPATGLTYNRPTEGDNKCRLDKTCCTGTAETSLVGVVKSTYQSALFTKLNATIDQCLNIPIQSAAAVFIDASKSSVLQSIQISTQSSGFQFDQAIVKTFFDYVKTGILNKNLGNLQTQFQTLYFKVFLVSFREGLKSRFNKEIATNTEFETCLYGVFLTNFGSSMTTQYNRLETRFNLYFRYLWALEVGDTALQSILSYSLSTDCENSLLRMDQCSRCSAHQDTPTDTLSCRSLCLNTLQGCLVDLDEFGDAYGSYVSALRAAKSKLDDFNPFLSINLMNGDLNEIIFTTSGGLLSLIKFMADSTCNTQYLNSKRRRSLPGDSPANIILRAASLRRARRQSTTVPLESVERSASCSTLVSDMFDSLASDMCDESSAVSGYDYSCWNGTDVDSYWWEVPGSGRLEQRSNPELYVRATSGLQYKTAIGKLKVVTADLQTCQNNPRTCTKRLSGLTPPGDNEYTFEDSAQFQEFAELGFPDPLVVSSVPVAPAGSFSLLPSSLQTTSIITTTANPIPPSSSLPSSSLPSSSPSSSSSSPIIDNPRPTVTSTSSTADKRRSTTVPVFTPVATNLGQTGEEGVPDADKSKNSAPSTTSSLVLLTSLVLLIVSIQLL